jgi:hypothetical protein
MIMFHYQDIKTLPEQHQMKQKSPELTALSQPQMVIFDLAKDEC